MDYDVIQIIEDSAFRIDAKTELKGLVKDFLAVRALEAKTIPEMLEAKAGVNERQYSKRLAEPMSDDKRNDVLTNQYAYRAWFANAVLRIHELRSHLRLLADAIVIKVDVLTPQAEPSGQLALVAMTKLIRERDYSDVDGVLAEFDNVAGITKERIIEAVRTIFHAKRENKTIFARPNFTSTHIDFARPTREQIELFEAIEPAIAVRQRFEDLWSQYYPARSKWNVPQFTKRLEQALTVGDTAKVEQIRKERLEIEAHLFVVASNWTAAYADLLRIIERLRSAIIKVANANRDDDSLESLKAMSHCLGAWHWLGELTGYITDKYNQYKPAETLAELDFDTVAYINA